MPRALRIARAGGFADLRARTLSSIVMIAAAAAAIAAGGIWFCMAVAFAAGIMMLEGRRIVRATRLGFGGAVYVAAVAGAAIVAESVSPPTAIVWLTAAAGTAGVLDAARNRSCGWSLAGALYIGLAAIFLIDLRADPQFGMAAVAFLVLIVAASDAGAYFAGRIIGGPKLWPAVSPNKTWAGAWGGVALAGAVGAAFAALALPGFDLALILVAALLAIASQIGDLGESAFKRFFGAKDSGRIIPGHGGVLDRLDGLIAASLVAASLVVAAVTLARGGASILRW